MVQVRHIHKEFWGVDSKPRIEQYTATYNLQVERVITAVTKITL